MKNPRRKEAMSIIQITHNDLDGYGASVVASILAPVAEVIHVTRYKDVVETLSSVVERVCASTHPTTVLMTDIGVERATALAIGEGAARLSAAGHRLVVIDHHASSLEHLALVAERDGESFESEGLSAVVDTGACATTLTARHAALYGAREGTSPLCVELCSLVNAVDLWLTEDAHFMRGMALNDAFWDVVSTYVPSNHPAHEGFVRKILLELASLSLRGATAAEIEDGLNAAKRAAVDAVAGPDPARATTSRLRLARVVANDRAGFAEATVEGKRALVTFAMEMGVFQRVSDLILEDEGVDVVINVMRSAGLSLRSKRGQALQVAKAFNGGGHPNATGADLGKGKCFSLSEAVAALQR